MTRQHARAAIVAVAPTVLFVGFAYHPYVANPTDDAAVAEAAAADPRRWGIAHLAIGVGYALLALAFIALRSHLRAAGEDRWSFWALPPAVLGCSLFPILTGMEFALLAAAETGGNVEAAQSELVPYFLPILAAGAISFALGACFFAVGVARSAVLTKRLTFTVVGALVVMAAARFVPLGAVQIVIGMAGAVAFWPLAVVMWRTPSASVHADPGSPVR